MGMIIGYAMGILTASLTFWLGLYIIIRNYPAHLPLKKWIYHAPFMIGISVTIGSIFLTSVVLGLVVKNLNTYYVLHRLTWWSAPIGSITWLWTIILFRFEPEEVPAQLRKVIQGLFLGGVVLALLGSISPFVFRVVPDMHSDLPRFTLTPTYPGFALYTIYLIGCFLSGFFLAKPRLAFIERKISRRNIRFRYISLANFAIMSGAIINLYFIAFPKTGISIYEGGILILLGLLLVGYGTLRFNLPTVIFIRRIYFQPEFLYTLTRALALVFGFEIALILRNLFTQLPTEQLFVDIPLFAFLAIVTNSLFDWGYRPSIIRPFFFSPSTNAYIRELRREEKRLSNSRNNSYVEILNSPHLLDENATVNALRIGLNDFEQHGFKKIQTELRRLFKHSTFEKDEALCNSPLQDLYIISGNSNGDNKDTADCAARAANLRYKLKRYFVTMIGDQDEPIIRYDKKVHRCDRETWIALRLIYLQYIEGNNREEVIRKMEESNISEPIDKYYDAFRKKGASALAEALHQSELAALREIVQISEIVIEPN